LDHNITTGPRAFEVFFEQFLYKLGNEYFDSSACIKNNNGSLLLEQNMEKIAVGLNYSLEAYTREGLIGLGELMLE
jgi:hypothetical protein